MSAVLPSSYPTIRHGPALNAGAEGSTALASECLHPDVVGGVRIKTLDSHVRLSRAVGAVLLAVDVPVHNHVVNDLAVPFGHQRGLPGQLGAGLGQSRDLQVEREARGHVFGGVSFRSLATLQILWLVKHGCLLHAVCVSRLGKRMDSIGTQRNRSHFPR